jgi:hypothetical protein
MVEFSQSWRDEAYSFLSKWIYVLTLIASVENCAIKIFLIIRFPSLTIKRNLKISMQNSTKHKCLSKN